MDRLRQAEQIQQQQWQGQQNNQWGFGYDQWGFGGQLGLDGSQPNKPWPIRANELDCQVEFGLAAVIVIPPWKIFRIFRLPRV